MSHNSTTTTKGQRERAGAFAIGILTDGKRLLLRWPGAGEPRTVYPYVFTLESEELRAPLFEWLRDSAANRLHLTALAKYV